MSSLVVAMFKVSLNLRKLETVSNFLATSFYKIKPNEEDIILPEMLPCA